MRAAVRDGLVRSMAAVLLRGLRGAAPALFAVLAGTAAAQPYPSKPITFVIGFSAGGTTDIIARVVAEEMRRSLGQPIVIENRAGASGNIAGAHVAKARPDGYTLFVGSVGPLAVNASLFAKMPFDHLKDLAPISLIAHVPNMLVVNPKAMPVASFPEFVALVKANPGRWFYGSTGSGTTSHMSGELLKLQLGLDITHVPYKGAVALNDLLAGEQVHFMFATIPSAIQHVKAGRVRALAVSSLSRSASLPDTPPVADFVPGFDASSWFGIVGPAGLPTEIAERLSGEIARIVRIPEVREKLVAQGADPVGSTPAEFGAYMRSETAKWARVAKASGARAE